MKMEHKQQTPFSHIYIKNGNEYEIDFEYDKKSKKLRLVAKKVKQNIFKSIWEKIINNI